MQDAIHGLPVVAFDGGLLPGVEGGNDRYGVIRGGRNIREQRRGREDRRQDLLGCFHWLLAAAKEVSSGEFNIARSTGSWSIAALRPASNMRGMAAVSQSPIRRSISSSMCSMR